MLLVDTFRYIQQLFSHVLLFCCVEPVLGRKHRADGGILLDTSPAFYTDNDAPHVHITFLIKIFRHSKHFTNFS